MSATTAAPAQLLDAVVQLARTAGRAIMDVYSTDFTVAHKADESPLTAADHAAHRVIVEGLRQLTPDIPVLSEESEPRMHEPAVRSVWQQHWLVDPLDGTKEFINRNGEFTVNIALIREHRPVLGVVLAPALDCVYFAAEGHGARRIRSGGPAEVIRARNPAAARPVVTGSRSHRGDSLDKVLERLGDHEFKSVGSALKLCLVAEGSADFYPRLGPTSEWDTAAGQAVLECAGGAMTDLEGNPFRYNQRPTLLNPSFLAYGDTGRNWRGLL